MSQYRTDQERIDAATLEIKNPNMVGSGYIQHPPQKPFAAPLQMQPPTVAHFEFPDEYSKYRAHTRQNGGQGQGPPRRAPDQRSQGYAHANGRPQNGPHSYGNSSGQQGSYRQPHAAPGRGPQHQAGTGSAPYRSAPRPGRGLSGASAPQAQVRPAAVPVVPPRAPNHAVPPQRQHVHSTARQAPPAALEHPQRPSHAMQQAAHAPAAPASHTAPSAGGQDTAALSQSEAQMTLADSGPKHAAVPLPPANGNAEEHADQAISKSQAKRLRKKKRESKV